MAQPQRKESQPRSVGHESIDGTLSGAVLQFNLASELDQLHRDQSWLHPAGRSSKTLVKYPDLRIVLIAMKANTRMHEHTAAGRISVHTLNGHIRLHLIDLVNYQEGAVVSRTLVNRGTGTVTLFAFDEGQGLSEHTALFDALAHLLEGEAEIAVSGKPLRTKAGEAVLMPANQPHSLKALSRFKMLLTMIRS